MEGFFYNLNDDACRSRTGLRGVGLILVALSPLATLAACERVTAPGESPTIAREPVLSGRLVAGSTHTCKLSSDGAAYCWGGNGQGQGGIGELSTRIRQPMAVATTLRFVRLAAGYVHTCGLTADGSAYCWGWNGRGELGDGTTQTRTVPSPVATTLRFSTMVGGTGPVTCGVTGTGQAYCWGQNSGGQVGDGTNVDRLTPTAVAAPEAFRLLTMGYETCGLAASGRSYCWGNNTFGGLGVGDTLKRAAPTPVAGGVSFAALAAGAEFVCGLTPAGVLYCWGQNNYGQLAQGQIRQSITTPGLVAGDLRLASLTAGYAHACGLAPDGRAYCWGANSTGAVGDGSSEAIRPAPIPVAGGLTFQLLVAGSDHTCGVTSSASLYCWGSNGVGQLGDSTFTSRNSPVLIPAP